MSPPTQAFVARTDTARADREQLVGLLTVDPLAVLPEGRQILADASVEARKLGAGRA
ncbi:MAG: hypothetical protein H0T80_11480 [Betaproteobacteria bacterium]|nr:hypothetical protein [Betaproteobacteria bacterium]